MATDDFKITIHMVSSLDGIIAKKDNSTGWFETTSPFEQGVASEDVTAFLKTIDCYVMGARTYEHAFTLAKDFGWPYGDTPTLVLTHRNLPILKSNIELYSGGLEGFVNSRLKPLYKNVWVVGGAALAKDFIRLNLAHEIRQSIIPIILGEGTLFFDNIGKEQTLQLKDARAYKNGMVELVYGINR